MADQSTFANPDSTSLFDFVAKRGNGIKGLVDSGIAKVPELYIQPPHERVLDLQNLNIPSSKSISSLLIPIDLSKLGGPEHEKVVDDIVRAAKTTGFFQVINHGVGLDRLESVKDAAHRFFDQPTETKAVYLKGASVSPYVRYNTSFAPDKEKKLEWRDHISMIYTNDDDAEKHWPSVCKKEVLDYMESSYKTARRLFEILIEHLGVEPEESMLESLIGFKVVNMNFYPACPNPELTIGAGRHSDMSTLTVLLQDENEGLLVKIEEEDVGARKPEKWIQIPPISGALVINVGDALQIISNDKYKSSEHKVRTTSKRSRVSIPLFVAPKPTAKIGPLPRLVERDGGAIYREVVYQDYRMNFFGLAHDGKKALDFAKINYPN